MDIQPQKPQSEWDKFKDQPSSVDSVLRFVMQGKAVKLEKRKIKKILEPFAEEAEATGLTNDKEQYLKDMTEAVFESLKGID